MKVIKSFASPLTSTLPTQQSPRRPNPSSNQNSFSGFKKNYSNQSFSGANLKDTNQNSSRQRFNNDIFLATVQMTGLNQTVHQSPERVYYNRDKQFVKKSSLFNSSQKKERVFFVDQQREEDRQLLSSRVASHRKNTFTDFVLSRQTNSTGIATTLYTQQTAPTPELKASRNSIEPKQKELFNNNIKFREHQETDRKRLSQGILKEQQHDRPQFTAPTQKGQVNTHFKHPSHTSNEIFYLDYKGNPKPNIARSQSVNKCEQEYLNSRANSRSKDQLISELRTQFLLSNDGSIQAINQRFGKRTSLNMKNFSSVSIGENDKIRQIYEDSFSKERDKSNRSQRNLNGSFNENQLNNSAHVLCGSARLKLNNQSMQISPTRARAEIEKPFKEEGFTSEMQGLLQTSFNKAKTNLLTQRIGNEETKPQWPSLGLNKKSSNQMPAFSRHSKGIPTSVPMKTILQQSLNQTTVVQSDINERNLAHFQTPKALVVQSNSLALNMTGDLFLNLNKQREQSREKMREMVIQRFFEPNKDRKDASSKENTSVLPQTTGNVSIQIGKEHDQEEFRSQVKSSLTQMIRNQLLQKKKDHSQESQRLMKEGRDLQRQWQQYNQVRNKQEKEMKRVSIGDQVRFLQDQQETLKKDLVKLQEQQNTRKYDEMAENSMIFKVKVMQKVRTFGEK